MDRRSFLDGLLTAPMASVAWAQPGSRIHRIGFLGAAPAASATASTDGLAEALLGRLRELGYAEGRNLVVERRSAEGRNERYRALAVELVNLEVDLIIAPGTAAALGAKAATSTIPIVTVIVGDPVGSGLVASLARPGGNITGMSSALADVTAKQLEITKEIMPRLSRVAVLWNRTAAHHAILLEELGGAARALGVRLSAVEVGTPPDLEAAFGAIARDRAEALIPLDDAHMFQERRRIAELALRDRLPTASFHRLFTEAGTLLSYGPSYADLYRRAATHVDRILRGTRPADLPVEQPTMFELVVNLRTTKALGLKIPPAVLQRADETLQ